MYLSGLLIDIGENPDRPRPGRLWIRNVYRVHQRLCMAFPSVERETKDPYFLQPFKPVDFIDDRTIDNVRAHVHGPRTPEQSFLFRIDLLNPGRAMIVVQSASKPNWHYAFQNADYLLAGSPVGPKLYNPSLENNQLYSFRLAANPTRKIDTKTREDGTRSNGNRVPVASDKVNEWLINRAERAGFKVEKFNNVQTSHIVAFKGKDARTEENAQNNKLNFFDKIIPLEHPRFIMQYKSKHKHFYIEKYVEEFRYAK